MVVRAFDETAIRHEQKITLMQPYLAKWFLDSCRRLLRTVPRKDNVPFPQGLNGNRAGWCVYRSIMTNAFSGLICCQKDALAVRRAQRVELSLLRVRLVEEELPVAL